MGRREYEIAFVGLQPGSHNFEYGIDDKFFEAYQEQLFSNCNAVIKLALEKNTGFMQLRFEVDGTVSTNCDRCGNDLTVPLWDEFNIIVKLVENPETMNNEEQDPDVYYIARTESLLYMKDWLYEFINLSVPLQNQCANNEKGESLCNQEVLDALQKLKVNESTEQTKEIWKGLDKFKNLDN
jgi:uncharacterized metal-binding protein YceD (DUF177 family)